MLRAAEKPSADYVEALKQCIREAYMSLHSRSKGRLKKMHRVGIASETNLIITRKMKRKEWDYDGHPDDTTIYRRLNEMANEADFLVFVEPKGCGWYALANGVLNK